jgi:hypothetical protein
MKEKTKKCIDCKAVLPIDNFYRSYDEKKCKWKYFSNCKKCYQAQAKAARKDAHKKKYDHRKIKYRNRGNAKLLAFWQSIPAAVKDNKYFTRVKNVKITEEQESLIPKLLEAKTVADLAKVLDVKHSTLSRWQKTNFVRRYTDKFDEWNNVMRFKKDVDYAFTQKTIAHADAARVKLWYQIYMNWMERSASVNEFDENNIVAIQKKLRELGTKKEEVKFYLEDDNKRDNEKLGANAGGFGDSEAVSEDII